MKTTIKKWGINGEGIAYSRKKAVFVENAIPDEVVDLTITENKPTYAIGKVNEIIEPSPRRRKPMCPHWEKCGGCSMMHVDYKGQVRMKMQVLKEALRKYANYTGPIEPLMKNPNPLGYRNACKLPFGKEDGKIVTGMYEAGTNDFVPISRCIIHSKKLEKVRGEITELLNEYSLPVSSKAHPEGLMYLVLKEYDGLVYVILVTSEMELPEELADKILGLEDVAGLWQSVKTPDDPEYELFGSGMVHLGGRMAMELNLKDFKLSLLPRSFFQLNTVQSIALYEAVASMIPEHSRLIVEAYSGAGAISLFVGDKADKVIGIENVEDAVASANENALANGKDNVHFVCADAAAEMKEIASKNHIDTLIADPPRSGLSSQMRDAIIKAAPETFIYVSCNPSTLAKDIADLSRDYEIKKVQPVDMFSQTPHIETVVLLSRKY